jgi:hypothetical protein
MRAVRLLNFSDPRSRELLERGRALQQELADRRLESEWRRRVRTNPKEIAALPRRVREIG